LPYFCILLFKLCLNLAEAYGFGEEPLQMRKLQQAEVPAPAPGPGEQMWRSGAVGMPFALLLHLIVLKFCLNLAEAYGFGEEPLQMRKLQQAEVPAPAPGPGEHMVLRVGASVHSSQSQRSLTSFSHSLPGHIAAEAYGFGEEPLQM
jgi:hypothetical protein